MVSTGTSETLLVPLSGGFNVESGAREYALEGRASVFDGVTDLLYLPLGSEAVLSSRAGGEIALASAEASRQVPAAYVPAKQVGVEVRGAGHATRQINNLFVAGGAAAQRLVVVEVLTPGGNWSSYPPHKHDEATPSGEVELEEIYYFRMQGSGGFGIHRTYTADRSIDETVTVRDGDVFLVPQGLSWPVRGPSRVRDVLPQRARRTRGVPLPRLQRRSGVRLDPPELGRPAAGFPGATGIGREGAAMSRGRAATERLTVAQALVRFLAAQRVERDGEERPFFAGVFGIFGHGNVAGLGQALQQYPDRLRYYLSRNEQAQVHTAAAYARMTNRLQTFACTSSVGPGATNMITGAAGATINRLPVLLLPGRRLRHPQGGIGPPAARGRLVSGCLGQRCLPAGVALLGPDQPAGAARLRGARGHAGAHQPGRHGGGDARLAPGRPDRSIRFSRRVPGRAGLARPAAAARRSRAAAGGSGHP